jgi:hypothetical protein
MIAIVLSSILSVYFFLVLGISFTKATKFTASYVETFLLGIVVTNTITTILSLFIPININVLVGFLVLCTVLLFFAKKEFQQLAAFLKTKKTVVYFSLPFILIALVTILRTIDVTDFGLYHLQTVKWIEQYSVVPGLANLHGRFGFNPNIFTLCALTTLFEFFNQEIFSINFVLFCIYVLYFINVIYSNFKRNGITNLVVFNFAVFLFLLGMSGSLSTPTPDFISITFPLYIFVRLINSFNSDRKTESHQYLIFLILGVYVATVKLAAIPIVILPIALIIKSRIGFKRVIAVLPFLCLILVPWLIRNVILSGWLIYPFPSLDLFSFDWQVPLHKVIREKMDITGWARDKSLAAAYMPINEWFPLWWKRLISPDKILFVSKYKMFFMASMIFPVVELIGLMTKRIKFDFKLFLVVLVSFIGVMFWFSLAPDFRFGKGFLIVSVLSPLLFLPFKIDFSWEPNYKPTYFLGIIIVVLSFSFFQDNLGENLKKIVRENMQRSIKPDIMESAAKVPFRVQKISGVDVYIPLKQDKCIEHCLPGTPYLDSTLVLRDGKTLQSGFTYVK